jgi:hypothetical protein
MPALYFDSAIGRRVAGRHSTATWACTKPVSQFGQKTLLKWLAQPQEMAPVYVFLAADADSSDLMSHFWHSSTGNTTNG